MQTRCDLAIVGAAQRTGVLPLHSDGMLPLLREAGVVYDERLNAGQLAVDLERQPPTNVIVVPRTNRDALLQPLAHRIDVRLVFDEAPGHRQDALARTIE